MGVVVRTATPDDLDAVVALTSASRDRLAAWSPIWWAKAPGADELHPLWLAHLLEADGPVVRVAVDDTSAAVVGCMVSVPQRGQWFVDDVAMADAAQWAADGATFLGSVPERPALTCVPVLDHAKTAAAREAGLTLVSTYWVGPAAPGPVTDPIAPLTAEDRDAVPPAPPHTFGGPFDPAAPGALAFRSTRSGGVVVGSPPVPPPPIYGDGRTVTIVDRIAGRDRAALLRDAIRAAGNRDDAVVAVVCSRDDRDLEDLLQEAELVPTVDVHRWPD